MRLIKLLFEISMGQNSEAEPERGDRSINIDDLASWAKEQGYYPSFLSACKACNHIYNPEKYGDCPNCDADGSKSVGSSPLYTSPYHAKEYNPEWLKTPDQISAFLANPAAHSQNGASL